MKTVRTTFLWRSPPRYFFSEGVVPEGLDRDEARDEISLAIEELLREQSTLLALEDYFNAQGSLAFEVNNSHIAGKNCDLPDEGEGRFEVRVIATGQMPENTDLTREEIIKSLVFLPESFLISVKETQG
jgi:hypothetical protein